MGVTIHYEGSLKSAANIQKVLDKATLFAEQNNMEYFVIDEPMRPLSRMKDEEEWNYESPVKGILILPDENAEPLAFEFDSNTYIQDFCKTQFAGIEVHIKIIGLLKEIEPYFTELIVVDEGEYWDNGDEEHLQEMLDDCFQAIEEARKENPRLIGPLKTEEGRIIDLMEE